MNRILSILTGFIVGVALMAALAPGVVTARPGLPAASLRVYPMDPTATPIVPTPEPVRPEPAVNPSTAVGQLGLINQVECWNCAPFLARARVTHYDPMRGQINCWDWSEKEKYCFSPTITGIHWKTFWGFGAACAPEWKIGSWVVVPNVGAFICVDRGNEVLCDPETKICALDILGPSGTWDGQIVDVTLWVPLDPPRGD